MTHEKKTLGDYALNPDGKTYNAAGAAQFLFKAATGFEMPRDEAEKLVAEAQEKARKRREQ